MKINLLLFICSFWFLSKAYSQEVVSLHPLFIEQDAVLIPEIEGSWCIEGIDTISIQKAGDNFYLLKYGSEANPSTFEAVFLKIKDQIYLDLNGVFPDTLGDEYYRNTFLSVHSLYKIEICNDTLQLFEPRYAWFYNYTMQNDSPLKYEWVKNGMLLTFKTDELKSFFAEQNNNQELFDNPTSFINSRSDNKGKENSMLDGSTVKSSSGISQTCIPQFPFKDGWFGGDGDVSVPINATTTLFIFSDTWVGTKNQQSRMEPGMKMVNNSVAVETCLPNGETDVKYYWRNKYSEHPKPIFESFTNRYIYWVPQAFMMNDNLYVLLEKVGPRLAAPPKATFNFSLLGYTLAKISNPDAAPDKWEIEYTPLPDFGYPSKSIGAYVILDGYFYFFVSRHDKAQVLVRKRVDVFDDPQKPYEYFALNKKWNEGLNTNDMDTLINGFRTTTVNYHPEMKQWVMICDIRPWDNKIKMRTAPELTGPWSDEIDIYEIPEVTPGNPSYTESNFCYLPRECIQNYDTARHQMLITYDINNPDFSIINANPKIYTPKVITIQLK
ncbi:hypothetical protein [Mangrovibacterium lignilyticum]|uniref:hypothetical protein n=1 Tax=Mangrovibacterium lignilyticum TaxID=2668052 RepID=UPI0013D580C7|nr:hypothetical protein [Mangrovibacterium lignilyticum]